MSTPKLPDKLSELMLVALADLEQVERDPRYKVEMGEWHCPNGKCAVCFAGAVMANTLGAPIKQEVDPGEFGATIEGKLLALDSIRSGFFWQAFNDLGIGWPLTLPDTYSGGQPPRYDDSRDEWWLHMQAIVGILQAEGL